MGWPNDLTTPPDFPLLTGSLRLGVAKLIGPSVFRVMTDRPGGHGGGAGQARHRDQLSVNGARSRHMTILRKGRRIRAIAPNRETS